ncbi:MAG: hypothetical protein U0230_03855 [Polyangiales bacterium]
MSRTPPSKKPKGTLLPLLQEADWSGGGHAVSRPLVAVDEDTGYVPLVSYAYDEGTRRLVLTALGLADEDRDLEAVEAEAVRNLESLLPAWQPQWAAAIALVHEYASSALLSARALDAACEALGASRILLAAPTRGLLVATARPTDGDANLGRWATSAFAASFETRLSPSVYAYERGGSLSLLARARLPDADGRTFEVRGYDAEEECVELSLLGVLGPAAVAGVRRLVAKGALDDGRPVALVRLVLPDECLVEDARSRFRGSDVELAVEGPDGSMRIVPDEEASS